MIKLNSDRGFYHEPPAIKDIPKLARLATSGTEDRRFYQEGSWDLPRIIKAGFDDVTHNGTNQGASTITEQLAKISFLGDQGRTIDRKGKQFILGVQIDNNFSTHQPPDIYMNPADYRNHANPPHSTA